MRTDPGYRLYQDSNLCFPAGKNPKKIYVTISGIKLGTDAAPDEPPPLNGTFCCEKQPGDFWTWGSDRGIVVFTLRDGFSSCEAGFISQWDMFSFWIEQSCIFSGESLWTGPERHYYGGRFVAAPRD